MRLPEKQLAELVPLLDPAAAGASELLALPQAESASAPARATAPTALVRVMRTRVPLRSRMSGRAAARLHHARPPATNHRDAG